MPSSNSSRIVSNEFKSEKQLILEYLGSNSSDVNLAARELFHRLSDEEAIRVLNLKLESLKGESQLGKFPLDLEIARILQLPQAEHLLRKLEPKLLKRINSYLKKPPQIHFGMPGYSRANRGLSVNRPSTVYTSPQAIVKADPYLLFFRQVSEAVKPPSCQVMWPASLIRENLTNQDFLLSNEWVKGRYSFQRKTIQAYQEDQEQIGNAFLAQMLSARCAEKTAILFYASLNYQVNDISIRQIKDETKDWLTHDIELRKSQSDESIYVDVKNARTPINHKNRYVDHCIPRFKHTRGGSEVKIIGVLSPYITPHQLISGDFEAEDEFGVFDNFNIRVLGEVTRSAIDQYSNIFTTKNFYVWHSTKAISPWLFDYPDTFYESQNESREYLKQLDEKDIPDWNICKLRKVNPIPTFLAIGKPLPKTWKETLTPWQIDFIDQLYCYSGSRVVLPILYLTILKHFLKMAVCKDTADYQPFGYRSLVYLTRLIGRVDGEPSYKFPLGIFDPLSLIDDFISTLSRLWDRRKEVHLDQFSYFRFNGLGLLEGKRAGENHWVTIIAYCGGKIKQMGKCGFSPLIIGVDNVEPCKGCGKLICPKCGYCSDPSKCSLCAPRMEKIQWQHHKENEQFVEFECERDKIIHEPPEEPPFNFEDYSFPPEEDVTYW